MLHTSRLEQEWFLFPKTKNEISFKTEQKETVPTGRQSMHGQKGGKFNKEKTIKVNLMYKHVIRAQSSHKICHNGFYARLGRPQTLKWSRHRSFLYRCDRSPGMHILKLGTEIPN